MKRRQESSTGMYHVMVKGINKERIFNQQREKSYLIKIILKHLELFKVEIYSYCIMSNHPHFIIRSEIQILSRFMAAVLSEYALYYNFKHQRNGHVFQNRFASECIENEKYFWMCLRYIHLNPVKAGMVNNLSKYKYSSVNEYRSNTAIVIHEKALLIYKKTFPDAKSFEEFHKERETKVFLDISEEMLTQRVELAIDYAESLQTKHNLPVLSQVFEEKDIRLAYIYKIKDEMQISLKKAKELCTKVQEKVINI